MQSHPCYSCVSLSLSLFLSQPLSLPSSPHSHSLSVSLSHTPYSHTGTNGNWPGMQFINTPNSNTISLVIVCSNLINVNKTKIPQIKVSSNLWGNIWGGNGYKFPKRKKKKYGWTSKGEINYRLVTRVATKASQWSFIFLPSLFNSNQNVLLSEELNVSYSLRLLQADI